MTQHASLSLERWQSFPHPQRILMIANEMNRLSRLMGHNDGDSRRLGFERVLRLVDLTVAATDRAASRRELLRWRDLVAAMYLELEPQPDVHRDLLRVLLQQTPESAAQLSHLGY